jgi:hypothetical protein
LIFELLLRFMSVKDVESLTESAWKSFGYMATFLGHLVSSGRAGDYVSTICKSAKKALSKRAIAVDAADICPLCDGASLIFDPNQPLSSTCGECGMRFDRCCASFLPLLSSFAANKSDGADAPNPTDEIVMMCPICQVFALGHGTDIVARSGMHWTWFGEGSVTVCMFCGMRLVQV